MKRNLLLTALFITILGALTAQAQTVLGEHNGLNFDGTNDNVSTSLTSLNTTITVEAWVNLDDVSAGSGLENLVSKWHNSTANRDFVLMFNENGNVFYFQVENVAGGGGGSATSTTTATAGTWYHVAGTYDGTDIKIYVNGSLENTNSQASALAITSSAVRLGNVTGSSQYLDGTLDDVRIWNTARTAAQIDGSFRGELCGGETDLVAYWDCNQGTAGGNNSGITMLDDKTSNNNDGTLNNFTKTGSSSNFIESEAIQSNSLDFDGTDDYVDIPHSAAFNTTTLTIEVWVKPETTTQQWSRIFSSNDNHFEITQRSNNLNRFGVYTNLASNSVVNSANWTAGTWYHVAAVWDNTNLELFVDGTSVGSTPATTPTSNNNRFIGDKPTSADHYFHGQLDEMRIWNVARTQMEISDNMNNELTSNTSNLIAYYKFNQGNADNTNTNVTTLKDLSENCNDGTLTNFALSGSSSNWTSGVPALPVDWTYFKGRRLAGGGGTQLDWQTASEMNNEGFEIQRSTNRQNWENIGFVNGSGTAYETQNYQFTDLRPHAGINYYRLKQIDFDGAFTYSDVVSVDFSDGKTLGDLKVIPNPVQSGEVTLAFSNPNFDEGTLEIYNTVGQLVRTEVLASYGMSIQIDDLPKGMYLFSVNLDGLKRTKKVIIE